VKLPVHGGTGPRSARKATGQYAQPFKSRAQHAKPLYTKAAAGNTEKAYGQLTGDPTNPQQPAGGGQNAGQPGAQDQAAAAPLPPGQFDLSADPVLQQVQASVARANADAGASALRGREQDLLQYGDSGLASSVLGANDPMVQAAGQNQESTLALLKRGYDQNLSGFDNNLDPSLLFSGARVKGEGLIGQDYQDRKASAAAQIQSELSQIEDAYNNALEGNQTQLTGALADAYARALQQSLTAPPATGDTATSTSTSTGSSGGGTSTKPKPKHGKRNLAHAAGGGGRPARAA
jgi:hypothetical protein